MEGVRSAPELRGITPNSFAHIFGHIAKMAGDVRYTQQTEDFDALTSVRYFFLTVS